MKNQTNMAQVQEMGADMYLADDSSVTEGIRAARRNKIYKSARSRRKSDFEAIRQVL